MLEKATLLDFSSNLAGETDPPSLVPEATGHVAALHFSGEGAGAGGSQEPRPSDVARKQLENERAAEALRRKLAETAAKEAQQQNQQ